MPSFNFKKIRGMFYYGWILTLSGVVFVLAQRSVNLIVGPVIGAETLGYFVVAAEFAILPLSKIMPIINQTMFPAYSKLQGEGGQVVVYLLKSIQLSALIIFPMAIGIACISYDFVLAVFGSKWLPMALPLALLACATPFRMITQVSFPALNALGYEKVVFIIHLISLILFSLGGFVGRELGILAIAVSWMVAIPCITLLTLYFVQKFLSVSALCVIKCIKPAIFGAVVMGGALMLLNNFYYSDGSVMQLVIKIIFGMVVYSLVVSIVFRGFAKEIYRYIFPVKPLL